MICVNMKYFIVEKLNKNDKTAMLKARLDVETILEDEGFKRVEIDTVFGVRKQKILKPLQIVSYKNNEKKWLKFADKFSEDDVVFIQYPLINAVIDLNKIVSKFKERKVRLIGITHDLETLRYGKGSIPDYLYNRLYKAEHIALARFDKIIVHNDRMAEKLVSLGFEKEKLVTLGVFDYLYNGTTRDRKLSNEIVVAGNLSKEKAAYLRKVGKFKNIKFNLYGGGILESELSKNEKYIGSFSSDELLSKLDGAFGLVWDGDSTDECSGNFGKYLIISNPHKLSMLIAAKLPIIVWKEAALAKFVYDNNIGWVVGSFANMSGVIGRVKKNEYAEKLNNIEKMSKKIRSGYFLRDALKRCGV